MKTSLERIEKRNKKLLKRETYFRKARFVYLGIAIIMLLIFIGSIFKNFLGPDFSETQIWLFILFVLIGYETHLQVRHIETIKYYRSKYEK